MHADKLLQDLIALDCKVCGKPAIVGSQICLRCARELTPEALLQELTKDRSTRNIVLSSGEVEATP